MTFFVHPWLLRVEVYRAIAQIPHDDGVLVVEDWKLFSRCYELKDGYLGKCVISFVLLIFLLTYFYDILYVVLHTEI